MEEIDGFKSLNFVHETNFMAAFHKKNISFGAIS